ncbi:Ethanolamine kinase [Halocaridina rubra]|uniref:ethanolamine kinase n=1 Tax=Halocaridina rubra TaxID=373956 RepID=A0AAN8X643_HALRR
MAVTLDLIIDGSSIGGLQEGAREIARHVRPSWKQEKLQFKVYTDGITNQLIGVWYDNRDEQLLVRVYGNKTELFIDRNIEKKNVQVLSKAGCGPPLYATFKNGLSYGFTKGVTLNSDTVIQEPVWQAVTKEMSRLHKIEEGNKENPILFPKLKHFLNLLPNEFNDPCKQKRIIDSGYTNERLQKEATDINEHIIGLNCPVVFSHNDLLLGNVIWDTSTQKASFIDYEYAECNYQPYDIANHFNEFADNPRTFGRLNCLLNGRRTRRLG